LSAATALPNSRDSFAAGCALIVGRMPRGEPAKMPCKIGGKMGGRMAGFIRAGVERRRPV